SRRRPPWRNAGLLSLASPPKEKRENRLMFSVLLIGLCALFRGGLPSIYSIGGDILGQNSIFSRTGWLSFNNLRKEKWDTCPRIPSVAAEITRAHLFRCVRN